MKENKILHGIYRLAGICQSYSILHYKVSIICYYIDLSLGLLSGCITTATGILLSAENKECEEKMLQENSIKIPLLFTSAIITFCQQFLSLSRASGIHLESYKKYQKMYNDIICFTSNNFDLNSQDNIQKNKNFLVKINQEINELIMKSPAIDPVIALLFHKKFKDYKIKIPELNQIETNENSPSNRSNYSNYSESEQKDQITIELKDFHIM